MNCRVSDGRGVLGPRTARSRVSSVHEGLIAKPLDIVRVSGIVKAGSKSISADASGTRRRSNQAETES